MGGCGLFGAASREGTDDRSEKHNRRKVREKGGGGKVEVVSHMLVNVFGAKAESLLRGGGGN